MITNNLNKVTTNYTIVTSDEQLQLKGEFTINENKKINYHAIVYDIANKETIGRVNYTDEYGELISYSVNVPFNSKTKVDSLFASAIEKITIDKSTLI